MYLIFCRIKNINKDWQNQKKTRKIKNKTGTHDIQKNKIFILIKKIQKKIWMTKKAETKIRRKKLQKYSTKIV